jgi:hypothetical protein
MVQRVIHLRGSFSDFHFRRGLRINLCDALYSERFEWRYLIHDEMDNDPKMLLMQREIQDLNLT